MRKYAFILMWGVIIFSILKIGGGVFKAFIFSKYDSSMSIDEMQAVDVILVTVVGLINLPWLFMTIIFIVLYSIWLYRISDSLLRQNIKGIKRAPGWAVAWNFIPLAQFFMPYVVIKEIWQATCFASNYPEKWQEQQVPTTMHLWWIVFVLGLLTWPNWFQLGTTLQSFQIDAWLTVFSGVCFVVSGLMLQKLMKQITVAQFTRTEEKASFTIR